MKSFSILFLADGIPQHEIEIAVQSFIKLFERVTPRHRRRMSFALAGVKSSTVNDNPALGAIRAGLPIDLVTSVDLSTLETEFSVMMIPASGKSKNLALLSLDHGLPVLGYDSYSLRKVVSPEFGILIPYGRREQNVQHFAEQLENLYFDPEVQKALKRNVVRERASGRFRTLQKETVNWLQVA